MTKVLVIDCETGEEIERDRTPEEEDAASRAAASAAQTEAAIAQAEKQRQQDLAALQAALPNAADALQRLMADLPMRVAVK